MLVVMPIDRMSNLVRKLAGTVAVLTNDEMGDTSLNETDVIEKVVKRLSHIFDVHSEEGHVDGKRKSKAERMLTGSKTTEIVTKGSIYRIQVVETTPKASHRAWSPNSHGAHGGADEVTITKTEEIFSQHPELSSMDSILRNPKASIYLKVFLGQHFQLENFAFWNEVEKFRSHNQIAARKIIGAFIADGALSQVNIEAKMRQSIELSFMKEDFPNNIFDAAQAEIYKVLAQNNHIRFVSSQSCQEYIEAKNKDQAPEMPSEAELGMQSYFIYWLYVSHSISYLSILNLAYFPLYHLSTVSLIHFLWSYILFYST
jgi:hypothetical protein